MANREAAIRPPSGEDLSRQNAWAALCAATEMDGKFEKGLILEYIYNKVRTYFTENS